MICLALSGTSVAESGKLRTDGMVNIGGILYPEEEMKDPERRKKAKFLGERIEKMKESAKIRRDYSNITTTDLLSIVLDSMANVRWADDLEELSKRPVETKAAIGNFLKNEKPFYEEVLFFSLLPSVAKVLGTEYHVEVTKRILDHPLAKKYDQVLIENKSSSMVTNLLRLT